MRGSIFSVLSAATPFGKVKTAKQKDAEQLTFINRLLEILLMRFFVRFVDEMSILVTF
jgi:hypothetical protein